MVFIQAMDITGKDIRHLCHNKLCVRGEHLSAEPHAVNNVRQNCVNPCYVIHWFVFYFDYAYLISLCDVTKPTIWPLPLQSICKYSNTYNFLSFLTDLDETGIKIHGLLRSFIVIARVTVPFKL